MDIAKAIMFECPDCGSLFNNRESAKNCEFCRTAHLYEEKRFYVCTNCKRQYTQLEEVFKCSCRLKDTCEHREENSNYFMIVKNYYDGAYTIKVERYCSVCGNVIEERNLSQFDEEINKKIFNLLGQE